LVFYREGNLAAWAFFSFNGSKNAPFMLVVPYGLPSLMGIDYSFYPPQAVLVPSFPEELVELLPGDR